MKKLGRFFKRNLQRIATVFCAVSVGIFSTLCPLSIAALADVSDVVDYVDYAFDSWANVPDDLKALGEAYVKFYKSTTNGADIGGAIDSIADIPKSWVKLIGDSQFILSPVMGVRYLLDNGTLKYSKKAADTWQSISDTCSKKSDLVVDGSLFKKAYKLMENRFAPTPSQTRLTISYRSLFNTPYKLSDTFAFPLYASGDVMPPHKGNLLGQGWQEFYFLPFVVYNSEEGSAKGRSGIYYYERYFRFFMALPPK